MKARKLTAVHVCEVTGYSRNQLRGLLDELPAYSDKESSPRIAREFSRSDLIVLSVVYFLENQTGVRRASISLVINLLRKTLIGPKTINRDARLLIAFDPPLVTYLNNELPTQDGILVSLGHIFEHVDQYLNFETPNVEDVQPELNFGPTLVSKRS